MIIKNQEEEAVYKENIEYTTFDGLEMMLPSKDDPNIQIKETSYELTVGPGE